MILQARFDKSLQLRHLEESSAGCCTRIRSERSARCIHRCLAVTHGSQTQWPLAYVDCDARESVNSDAHKGDPTEQDRRLKRRSVFSASHAKAAPTGK
jgi:hypothetical protein